MPRPATYLVTYETVISAAHLEPGDILRHGFNSRIVSVAFLDWRGAPSQVIVRLASGAEVPGFSPRARLRIARPYPAPPASL